MHIPMAMAVSLVIQDVIWYGGFFPLSLALIGRQ